MSLRESRLLISVLTVLCAAAWIAAAPAEAAASHDIDAWVASLEGGWSGNDNQTPLGRMPFAILFERQEDGSLASHTATNRETFIAMRLFKDDDGRWLLEESGGMEGLGVRGSTLIPGPSHGEMRRWVSPVDPDDLIVDMAVTDESLFVNVLVRGQEHAQFNLKRVPQDQLPAMREALAKAAQCDPEDASIHDHANSDGIPESVRHARQQIAERPGDAAARMTLASALIELIQSDSAMAPRYAGELLQVLRTAVELDPDSSEAWQGLGGYYLNAPPIAGGSLDMAEEAARRLLQLDADAGRTLLAQVESRRQTE